MDSIRKDRFKRTLLSSAILISIQSFTSTASAGICPPPNLDNNIHVAREDYCNGGIAPGASVNDIGIEGAVQGDVINDVGMSDFWMSSGTLQGSFINNDVAGDLDISNGSRIYSNIHNLGEMRFLRITDAPGTPTQLDGSIINGGSLYNIELSGGNVRVSGNIHNGVSGSIDEAINIRDGATVGGDIINDGGVERIMVDGGTVEKSLINNGQISEVIVTNGGHVKENMVNTHGEMTFNDDGMTHIVGLAAMDGATVDGNLVNEGNTIWMGLFNEATVRGNVENRDNAIFVGIGDGSSVGGSVINTGSTAYLEIWDGSTITENLVNHGLIEDGISVDGSTINGDLINAEDGLIAADDNAISLAGRTAVGAIINNGTVSAGNYGIFVDGSGHDGASVTGDIINTSDGVITTGDNGIYVVDGMVDGSIINDGTITSTEDNAIDIEDSVIGQNIIVNGNLTTHEDYDALDVNDSLILGNVITGPQSLISSGEDVLDIDESVVDGSVISEAIINASDEGFDFDNTHITNNLINKGQITAGRTGMSFAGEIDYVPVEVEMPDGGTVMMVDGDGFVMEPNIATIGNDFVNEGEINAGERGIELELVEIGKNFENLGTIRSDTDTTIHISASTIQGDFINRGDLHADLPPAWDEGGYYYSYTDQESAPEGSVTLTSMGIDDHNQTWLKISNEGDSAKQIQLEEVAGGFTSNSLWIYPGQEIFINAGEHNGGEQSYQLIDTNAMEQLAVEAVGTQNFMPEIRNSEQVQRGIALMGDLYDDDELMMSGQVTIGGNVVNEGAITAIDEAIYLEDVTIGDNFTNSGPLTSLTSDGILLQDSVTIGGNFTNSGEIQADETGIRLDGDAYLDNDGILVGDGPITIGGNFINSGDIVAADNGIWLTGAELGGNFINQGDITSEGNSAIEIRHAIINGNIENYGHLTVTEENEGNHGLSLKNSHVKGSILNFGNMNVDGTEGIYLEETLVEGSIYNDDGVTIDAYSDAILLDDGTIVQGDLINHGTLIARNHDGIDLDQTNIDGSVINTGSITSGDNAFELDGESDDGDSPVYMMIQGSLVNSGNLTTRDPEDGESIGNGNGFDMDYVDIRTDFANTGDINSVSHGFLIQKSRIGGQFFNSGNLNVTETGIILEGGTVEIDGDIDGQEEIHRVIIGGGVVNEGDINAGQAGIMLDMVDINGTSPESTASFVNAGDIEVSRGSAITLNDTTMAGDFVNTGNLSVADPYVWQPGDSYRKPFDGVLAPNEEFPAGIQLEAMGRDDNGDAWFRVQLDQNEGGFPIKLFDENGEFSFSGQFIEAGEAIYINAGSIEGDVTLMLDFGGMEGPVVGVATPSDSVFDPEYDPHHGILVTDSQIAGSVINQGNIDSYHTGIVMEHADMGAGFSNTGTITSQHSGIELSDLTIGGNIYNGGSINTVDDAIHLSSVEAEDGLTNVGVIISAASGIVLTDVELAGGIYNSGSISARDDGIHVYDSELNGSVVNAADGIISLNGDGYSTGILLDGVSGVRDFVNQGAITQADDGYGDGMLAIDVTMDGVMANTGTIEADSGMVMYSSDGTTDFINEGTIISNGSAMNVHYSSVAGNLGVGVDGIVNSQYSGIHAGNIWNVQNLFNYGQIEVSDGDGIYAHTVEMDQNVINTGTISAGNHGIGLYDVEANSIQNSGSITAGTYMPEADGEVPGPMMEDGYKPYGSGIVFEDGSLSGDISNFENGQIEAATHGLAIHGSSTIGGIIANAGTITASDAAIAIGHEYSDGLSSVGGLTNTGTIISQSGAALRVVNSAIGSLFNSGTMTGGQVSGDTMEATRTISDGDTVAMDFRTAMNRLDLFNGTDEAGNTGVINGDIYGSNQIDDLIEMAAGSLNGNVYDVEAIDITGAITLNNSIFSFNDSSTLTVKDTGTLAFGTTNKVTVQGSFVQDGAMTVVLNENVRSLDDPLVDATGSADINEGSMVALSVEDRNIANFNPGFDGRNVHLVHADGGVSDSGLAVQSDSILFNYSTFTDNDGTEFGVIGTVTDLGTLATSGGASTNAANAISTFQGDNSEGLVDLYTSNPELYNAIYDGDEASLTQLAELLIAGNPGNSIAASQNAQNEAINTILSRIADLRTGASGISAGDNEEASDNYLRPDSLWIRAIYSDGDQKDTDEFGGYSLRSKGFTLGADRDVNDYLTLGLGMTMLTSTANQTSSGTSGNNSETDTYLGSLYAGWRNQDYFVDANLNVGTSKTDLSGAGWDTRFDSSQIAISVLAGKSFLFNNNDSLIEPSLGVNFSRLKSDSYSYDSTNIGATSLKALELGAGVRYMTSFDVGSGLLLPEVSLMAWHDFKAEAVETEIGFENSIGSFTYFGPEAVKNRYQASAGVEYWMDNNFTLSLNYDHNWQSGFKADTVQAKLRYDF